MFKSKALRYDTKIKVYCDGTVRQKIYKDTKYKDLVVLDDDIRESKKGRIAIKDLTDDSVIRLDSLARSRDLLIDYASNNCDLWLSFVTLTFKENVTDLDLANKVILNDSKVDKLYDDAISYIIENTNNGKFSSAFSIYTTLVVKYIERIADHAVNIAEWVIYILNGYHKDKQIF